jgi:hypothetical protein
MVNGVQKKCTRPSTQMSCHLCIRVVQRWQPSRRTSHLIAKVTCYIRQRRYPSVWFLQRQQVRQRAQGARPWLEIIDAQTGPAISPLNLSPGHTAQGSQRRSSQHGWRYRETSSSGGWIDKVWYRKFGKSFSVTLRVDSLKVPIQLLAIWPRETQTSVPGSIQKRSRHKNTDEPEKTQMPVEGTDQLVVHNVRAAQGDTYTVGCQMWRKPVLGDCVTAQATLSHSAGSWAKKARWEPSKYGCHFHEAPLRPAHTKLWVT